MVAKRTAEQMEAALRSAGYRITPQRRVILQYLAATDVHPSARQIMQEVGKKHPKMSLATVYNTLGTLARTGLIKVLEFEVENRVEANLSFHINLICTECQQIRDLLEDLTLSPQEILTKTGFKVMDHRLEYYGLCEKCQEKERGKIEATEPHRKNLLET